MHNPYYLCVPTLSKVIVNKYDLKISVDKRFAQNYFPLDIQTIITHPQYC